MADIIGAPLLDYVRNMTSSAGPIPGPATASGGVRVPDSTAPAGGPSVDNRTVFEVLEDVLKIAERMKKEDERHGS
jgi:hypothetical protein